MIKKLYLITGISVFALFAKDLFLILGLKIFNKLVENMTAGIQTLAREWGADEKSLNFSDSDSLTNQRFGEYGGGFDSANQTLRKSTKPPPAPVTPPTT